MKNITLIGAGRSASSLIKYLLEQSLTYDFQLVVADQSLEIAKQKINNHPNGKAVALSLDQTELRQQLVQESDVVISMLPAFMHTTIAEDCLAFGKHLVTDRKSTRLNSSHVKSSYAVFCFKKTSEV